MARKPKPVPVAQSPAEVKRRVDKALKEGRSQQALELAKELCRHEPTPDNQVLLRRVYLERIRQFRSEGRTRDAVSLLEHVLKLEHTEPAWLEQLAVELANCGDFNRAAQMAERAGNPQVQVQILATAADLAVGQGRAGRAMLPEPLRPQFDLILQGFTQCEAGQDDTLKETLQGIGLQSPFLEWKLLLRGFQAYYAGDDVRAVENWSRLKTDRLPARMAAPVRFGIDSAFRQAQLPETQNLLQRQADRLQGASLPSSLRGIQAALAAEKLHQAFRLAEGIVGQLQQQSPGIVGRLARLFQAAMIHCGDQQDLQRYRRIFGAPADDPDLARLEAIAMEHFKEFAEAHRFWQKYEKSVAEHASAWPPGHADKVRSLIWARMGENAAQVPDFDQFADLPPFFRDMPNRPQPLKPSAEECFDRSLKLDPEPLQTYQDLLEHFQRHENSKKVEETARRLLARFPDHGPTLEILADLRTEQQDYVEALELLQRARKANPLEPRLQHKVSGAHVHLARSHAEAGRYDQARAGYQASIASETIARASVYCKWAACELKAGESARAEELLQQAMAEVNHRLSVAYMMVVETTRLKLKPAVKKRFATDFAAALAEPPSVAAAIHCLDFAGTHRTAKIKYTNQKSHEQQLVAYLGQVPPDAFTADELVAACMGLIQMLDMKQLRHYAKLGQKRFPANPRFLLFETDTYLLPKVKSAHLYKVQAQLRRAKKLAERLPTEEQKEIHDLIDRREEAAGLSGPFAGRSPLEALAEMMDMFGGPDDDDYDDDDDKDYF